MKDCPRCGSTLSHYALAEGEAYGCDSCGWVGVDVEHGSKPVDLETWHDAISRFESKFADDGNDEVLRKLERVQDSIPIPEDEGTDEDPEPTVDRVHDEVTVPTDEDNESEDDPATADDPETAEPAEEAGDEAPTDDDVPPDVEDTDAEGVHETGENEGAEDVDADSEGAEDVDSDEEDDATIEGDDVEPDTVKDVGTTEPDAEDVEPDDEPADEDAHPEAA